MRFPDAKSMSVSALKCQNNDGYSKKYFGGGEKFPCSYVSFPKGLKAKASSIMKLTSSSIIVPSKSHQTRVLLTSLKGIITSQYSICHVPLRVST